MSCITIVSFSILINGATSPFFHAERRLWQECPLSLLLFLSVAEELSRSLTEAKRLGSLKGIQVSHHMFITHLLFVDGILIFSNGSQSTVIKLNLILETFSKPTGMTIKDLKSYVSFMNLSHQTEQWIISQFNFYEVNVEQGIKKYRLYHQA